jgi:hypothetical protein
LAQGKQEIKRLPRNVNLKLPRLSEKATLARGFPSILLDFQEFQLGSSFCLPISQMDVLFNLATFVPVFVGFVRSISGGPERVLTGPDHIADHIQ